MKYMAVAFFLAAVLACGVEGGKPEPTPELDSVYATANARIDQMQTRIAGDLTAEAIKKSTPGIP